MENEPFFDKINDYLWQNLSNEELASFEEALKTNEQLREEVALRRNADAYIHDLMSEPQKTAFEQALSHNEALKKEIEIRRVEYAALHIARRNALNLDEERHLWYQNLEKNAENNKDTEGGIPKPLTGRVVKLRPIHWLAAAASVLFMLSLVPFWAKQSHKNTLLAADSYQKTEVLLKKKEGSGGLVFGASGDENSPDVLLDKAHQAFQKSNYQEADNNCRAVIADTTSTKSEIQKAQWLFALNQLAWDKTDAEFKNQLEKIIAEPNHLFGAAAMELRDKTHSIWWRIAHLY